MTSKVKLGRHTVTDKDYVEQHNDLHCHAFVTAAACIVLAHKVYPEFVEDWREDILQAIHDIIDQLGEIN